MRTVHIEAKPDHLLRLARQRDPVGALVEIIWNALDAEAHVVKVDLEINDLNGVESVRVVDDGHGMPHDSCSTYFGGLGGSWKTTAKVSPTLKRGLHGRSGQGRLRAFALGEQVRWVTVAENIEGARERTVISGAVDRPADFDISEPEPSEGKCGTKVEASVPADFVNRLTQDDTAQQLASVFAPFLAANQDVRIVYQGITLDPSTVWTDMAEYPVRWPDADDHPEPVLRVIEWPKDVGRVLALCDANGVVLDELSPGIQAPGYHFTAYLLWNGFVERRDDLPLAELDELSALLALARETLRTHVRKRDQERRARLIHDWKSEGVYPYTESPAEPAQAVEQEMFDEVATRISRRLPGATQSKKTTLRLLREVLSRDPSGLYPVLDELFRLPQSEQEELKRILQRTSLSEVIKATGHVSDRLDFLAALKRLVFDPEVSQTVKERSELHKILERETWIFGDAYALMVSDQSLDAVLLRHLKELGRDPSEGLNPVRREDGRTGIVDLLLGRAHRASTGREHLVVELKAPGVRIGQTEVAQIKSYAEAIANDPQFREAGVRWDFWVVSTKMSDVVRLDASAPNRPPGCIAEWASGVRIWARTWGEIIEDCEDRLHFYRERLNHDPATEHAVEYLRRVHGDVIRVD
ncbi:ATP-binding protein [Herbidospora sp. RD11066]